MVGASGCGKSTFIKLLSGNYSDYQGGIYYDSVEFDGWTFRNCGKRLRLSTRRHIVSMIPYAITYV